MSRKPRPEGAPLLDVPATEPKTSPRKPRRSKVAEVASKIVDEPLQEKAAAPITPAETQAQRDARTRTAGAEWAPEQIALMQRTIAKGLTDDQFRLLLAVARRTRLDPLQKQIYGIPRKAKQEDGSYKIEMTIQTGIDGYRAIADRTGRYAPGRETEFVYEGDGKTIHAARAYVKKQTKDGTWHEVVGVAFWAEYVPKKDPLLWVSMPHGQIAKCAEALALRRAFPGRFGDLYVDEEMDQAGDRLPPPKGRTAVEAPAIVTGANAGENRTNGAAKAEPAAEPKETVTRYVPGETKGGAPGTAAAIKRYAVDAGVWNDDLKAVILNDRTAGNLGFDKGAGDYSPTWLADQINAQEIIETLQALAVERRERRAERGVDTPSSQE